jgi:hypothetical protein
MAYAREPLVLAAGWELAAVGAYFHLYAQMTGPGRPRLMALVHGPGLFVLVPAALGLLGVLEPPQGGAAVEWPTGVTLLVAVAVLARILYRPPYTGDENNSYWLSELYGACAPFLLAKMLVGGRWDEWATWGLALVATVTLGMRLWQSVAGSGESARPGQVVALVGVIGFTLASLSPLAGLGGVLMTATAAVLAGVALPSGGIAYRSGLTLAGVAVGVWLVSQGALSASYELVAVLALPAVIIALSCWWRSEESKSGGTHGAITVLTLVAVSVCAIYPQIVVEWLARPAVQTMAGGVGATAEVVSNWGLGLQVVSSSEVIKASLPATGVGVAVFVAWAALFWIRSLLRGT